MELGGKKKDSESSTPRCLIKLRFLGCLAPKVKLDGSLSGPSKKDGRPVDADASSSTTLTIADELIIPSQLRRFSFNELKLATRHFRPENIIGEGGFGSVFKGWINEIGSPGRPGMGLPVAIKTHNKDGLQGHREWLAEINYLGELHHPNLVELIGYCIEDERRLLVYEFMARGSLDNHLFRRSVVLPWSIRMKILLGAAKGLAFCHEEAQRPVIFRDFKASNILLDADYNAKLSDFGLAKDAPEGDQTHVSTRVMGTYGYAAPEYVMTGHLTSKSDVYSFGVVLLEMLTGKRAIDKSRPRGQHNLVDWAKPQLRDKERFYRMIDPRLQGHFSMKGAKRAANLATGCLVRDPKARPKMSEIVQVVTPLVELNDMASSSPTFQAIQAERSNYATSSGQRAQVVAPRNRLSTATEASSSRANYPTRSRNPHERQA